MRAIFNVSYYRIQAIILEAEKVIDKSPYKTHVDSSAIIEGFKSGKSVLALAGEFKVSRQVISKRLKDAGIVLRTGSEANIIRMANTSAEQRRELVKKANEAMRNMPDDLIASAHCKMAITRQRSLSQVGDKEIDLFNALQNRGYDPVLQFPFMAYNIDIACGKVAVEIHNSTANPHTIPKLRKRIENLLKHGWSIIYVKIPRKKTIDPAALEEVISFHQSSSRNESAVCQYRVIDSAGKLCAAGHFNGNNFSLIPASESLIDIL
jgi:hypothetical protein